MLLQNLVSGVTLGAVYALVGLGFITVYNTSRIINVAQGEFVMLGGMFAILFLEDLKLPYGLTALLAVACVVLLSLVMYGAVIVPLRRASVVIVITATLAVSLFLQNGAMLLWGTVALPLSPISGNLPLRFAGVAIAPQSLWVIGVTVCMLAGLHLLANRTLLGKAMTACATDPLAANLVGITTGTLALLAFAISAAVGAVAGILISPLFFISYGVGGMVGFKGMTAAILGGWGKSTGAVLGGLTIGILEALSVSFLPAQYAVYKDGVAFVGMLLILSFRPTGILGTTSLHGLLDRTG